MSDLEIAKEIIKDNIGLAECGVFDTRNILGDPMHMLYRNSNLQIDVCISHGYFEVFGLTEAEFIALRDWYDTFVEEIDG